MVLANLHRASSLYAEISSITSAGAYYLMPCITHAGVDHVRSLCSCCLDSLEDVHCSFNFDPLDFSQTSDEHTTARHAVTKGKSIYNTDTVVSGTKYSANYLIIQLVHFLILFHITTDLYQTLFCGIYQLAACGYVHTQSFLLLLRRVSMKRFYSLQNI